MIDYDEMERVLAEEEQKLALEEAERKRAQDPEAGNGSGAGPGDDPDDGNNGDIMGGRKGTQDEWAGNTYEIQLSVIEGVRSKLNLKMESARADYDAVEGLKKQAYTDLLGTLIGFLIHTGGYPAIFGTWLYRSNAMTFVSGLLLGVLWLPATAIFFRKLVVEFANYRIRCSKRRYSRYIEKNNIRTFEREKEEALEKIHLVKANLEKLDTLQKRLEKKGTLSESENETVLRLGMLHFRESRYLPVKITTAEFFHYLFEDQ